MKYLISAVFTVFLIFFGIKYYFIFQLTKNISDKSSGAYNSAIEIKVPKINEVGEYLIDTNSFVFKSNMEFDYKQGKVESLSIGGDSKKYVSILDITSQPPILESFQQPDLVKTFNRNFNSDYELMEYCYKLSYENLNLFTPFNELKTYPICFILRDTMSHQKQGIYLIKLANGINVIQHGDVEFGTVSMQFYNSRKQIFSITFLEFEQSDIDLFLNTVKFK